MSIDYSEFAYPKPPKTQKKPSKPIKGKKHRQTKETDISTKVKIKVWERDKHRCIFCKKLVTWNYACCHYIPRSAGGLGIEENIFTGCDNCHIEQDNGLNTLEYKEKAKRHLKSIYGEDWNEKKLIYRKYKYEGGI